MNEVEPITERIIPFALVGAGGVPKPIMAEFSKLLEAKPSFPGFRGGLVFDFDPASVSNGNGKGASIARYLRVLPKKELKQIAAQLRRGGNSRADFQRVFGDYVDLGRIRVMEAPGLNLEMQSASLGWRLVWEQHVRPELRALMDRLHPSPRERDSIETTQYRFSNRSMVWVIAGGASTTGPSGFIPLMAELRQLLPPETTLNGILLTPGAYRDKAHQHRTKGQAIFRATVETLFQIYDDKFFDEPYGRSGYRISMDQEIFDHLFLIDGTFGGGRFTLSMQETARMVALFLYRTMTTHLAETLLARLGDLHDGGQHGATVA